MHHFATTALGTVGADRLEDTLRRLPHDVVHFRASVSEVDGVVWLGKPESGIPARRLRSLLRSRARMTRLVVLEIDRHDVRPALLLARRLRGRAGPTVIVTDAEMDFHDFYLGIAHSEDLRYITSNSHRTVSDPRLPRLVMSDGGAELLDLRAIELHFRAQAEAQSRRVEDLTSRVDTTQLSVSVYEAAWSSKKGLRMTALLLGYDDLARARKFFVDALGFVEEWNVQVEDGGLARVHVRLGDTLLMLDKPAAVST